MVRTDFHDKYCKTNHWLNKSTTSFVGFILLQNSHYVRKVNIIVHSSIVQWPTYRLPPVPTLVCVLTSFPGCVFSFLGITINYIINKFSKSHTINILKMTSSSPNIDSSISTVMPAPPILFPSKDFSRWLQTTSLQYRQSFLYIISVWSLT